MKALQNNGHPERRSALAGFGLALALTLAAFAIVTAGIESAEAVLGVIAVLAVLQIVVRLWFFLHLDLSKSRREDLQLILLASLIIIPMVGGSISILWSLHMRMMPM